jgi:hypothetical protein
MLLWQPHQSFPETESILVTGDATVPTDTVVGSGVLHPPADATRRKSKMELSIVSLSRWTLYVCSTLGRRRKILDQVWWSYRGPECRR